MPTLSSSCCGPIPESSNSCGEPIAPALTMTSFAAWTPGPPPAAGRYSPPVGMVRVRGAAVAAGVVALRDAGRNRVLDELARGRQDRIARRNSERPLCIVCRLVDHNFGAWRQALALLEIGEHLGIAPAGGAALGPGVEVAGIAAHVHHVVDARR